MKMHSYLWAAVAAVLGLFAYAFTGSGEGLMLATAGAITPEKIKACLDRISDQVEAFKGEYGARLQTAEQVIAGLDAHGARHSAGSVSMVGAQVLHALDEDSSFTSAAEAARRGGKLPHFNARINVDAGLRAALTNEGGSSSNGGIPSAPERSGIFASPVRPLRLLDVLPSRPTTSDSVEHVRLTASGNAAEQIEEGAEKAELAFSGELVRAEICTVAAWAAASRQVLADHASLLQLVDQVLRDRVAAKLEHLLINSAGGSSGKIEGLLAVAATHVPLVATTVVDTIGEAVSAMANAGYRASAILLHPSDWFAVQTLKSNTEGLYLLAPPTTPLQPSLWGVPVVTTPSIAAGTALTFDSRYTTILDREQLSVSISNSHLDFFTRNLTAVLAELRAGLEVTDPFAVFKFDLPSE